MGDSRDRADKWERGCRADPIRNELVIPTLIQMLAETQPRSILDVGCGTGYIAREVDRGLDFAPRWTLLDLDQARLSLAADNAPFGMNYELAQQNLFSLNADELSFDLVLAAFTLLEIPSPLHAVGHLSGLVRPGGQLIVVMPDCLNDVWASPISPQAKAEFVSGSAQVEKIDKFTGTPYPFNAVRTEFVIDAALRSGLRLAGLTISGSTEARVFFLRFERAKVA